MQMFTDWRFLFLLGIAIAGNFFFWYRGYVLPKSKRWWYSNSNESKDFSFVEGTVTFILFTILCALVWNWGVNNRISNYHEEIGGYITGKWYVDGEHQDSEETCTGSGEDRSCTTRYWTVYHTDFLLSNSTGDWWGRGGNWVQRIDKQEILGQIIPVPEDRIPGYWKNSYVGKPISWENSYPNYIAAINEEKYKLLYESYSSVMVDICGTQSIRADEDMVYKAIPLGFQAGDLIYKNVMSWNFSPVELNTYDVANIESIFDIPMYMDTEFGYLGGKVQGDTYIYVVNSNNLQYADMCISKWRGGSKNGIFVFIFGNSNGTDYNVFDVVIKLGVDGNDENTGIELDNKETRSNEGMKYDIRNELLDYFENNGKLEREYVLPIVLHNVETQFERQEMSNFKKLKEQIVPTNGWMTGMFIVTLLVYFFSSFYLSNNEN